MTATTINPNQPAERVSQAHDESPSPLISRRGWIWIIVIGGLFAGLHLTYLERSIRVVTGATGDSDWQALRLLQVLASTMTSKWNPDWSHAMVIPLISLYFIYQSRAALALARPRISWWGLAITSFGLLSYTWWIFPGRNDMFQGASMIVTLFGLVLFLLGPQIIRIIWFPILYLGFAIKISDAIWEQIAWKMQQIASACSHIALKFCTLVFNFDVERDGNTLTLMFMRNQQMVSEKMNVAEACSGLRMLMAFIALSVALAFMSPRPWWQRLLMVAAAVPVAILVNVGRVTTIGLLYLVNPELSKGDFHTFVGMLMLIPAAGLILLIGWCANNIVIREPNKSSSQRSEKIVSPTLLKESPVATESTFRGMLPGIMLGALLTIVLGIAYLGMWYAGRLDLLADMPQQFFFVFMLAAMVSLSLLIAFSGHHITGLFRPGRRPALAMGLVASMLLTAWVSQSAIVHATEAVLIKKAVPLRKNLAWIPEQIGPWKMVIDERGQMSKEIIEVLGTTKFISRYYINTEVTQAQGFDIRRSAFVPGSVVRVHVAYYTGNPDTVPHVPDRCFLASGSAGVEKAFVTLTLDDPKFRLDDPDQPKRGYLSSIESNPFLDVRIPALEMPVTRFTYAHSDQQNSQRTVIYYFAANGKFLASPNDVRLAGTDPRDEYAYYCKIEVNFPGIADPQEAEQRTADLLEQFLPEIMACLPDWVDVTEGRWPEDVTKNDVSISSRTARP